MNRWLIPVALVVSLVACSSTANPKPSTIRPSSSVGRPGTPSGSPTTALHGTGQSPDGTQIAFVRSLAGREEIYVARADGSHAVAITNGFMPSWSPDGTQIAFLRDLGHLSGTIVNDPLVLQLWLIRPDGSGLTKLAQEGHCCIGGRPSLAWSDDGSHVLFSGVSSKAMDVPTGA